MSEYALTEAGPTKVGSVARGKAKVAGVPYPLEQEAVEVEAGQMIHWKSARPIAYEWTYHFSDAEGGTHVDYHRDTGSFGSFFGKLADPIVVRMFARDVRTSLQNLKDLLEA